MPEFLAYTFMQHALLAALLVGVTAPAVGVYLVQRRLSLIGDGIGHVAVTGVALGLLTGASPTWTAVGKGITSNAIGSLTRSGSTIYAGTGEPNGSSDNEAGTGLFASTDDWDDQLGAWESGWPAFFRILRLYLTHFRGQDGVNVAFVQASAEPAAVVWERVAGALGLAGAATGDHRRSPEGVRSIKANLASSADESQEGPR